MKTFIKKRANQCEDSRVHVGTIRRGNGVECSGRDVEKKVQSEDHRLEFRMWKFSSSAFMLGCQSHYFFDRHI